MTQETEKKYLIPEVYAARTDVGSVREHNEDALLAASPLFVVADGMGGHESGEVASEIAISTMLEKAPTVPDGDALINAVKAANTAVIRGVEEGIGRPGMGTTITAAQIFDDQLFIVQVGDSRAYLLHEGQLQRITRDHSLVFDLMEQGRLTEEEARLHPQRSVITRALGSDLTVEPDLYVLRVSDGDRLLMCTDGLCGQVPDEVIAAVLNTGADAQEVCDALTAEALAAGGSDNITVLVVDPFKKMPEPGKRHRLSRREAPESKVPLVTLIWVAALVVILIGAGIGIHTYAKHSYYLAVEDGYVNIYRGLPGSFGPFKLSWLEERTSVEVDQLPDKTASRLEDGEPVSSLDEAYAILEPYAPDRAEAGTSKE